MTKVERERKRVYAHLLLDPRWRRRRLDIIARDKWTCQDCGKGHRILHVHHEWYDENLLPWQYPDSCLVTLCASCHKRRTVAMREQRWQKRLQDDTPPVSEEFARVFQTPLRDLLVDRRMKGMHWRMFVYLLSRLPYSGRITMRQADIAQDLAISISQVSKALIELVGWGVLEKCSAHTHPATYAFPKQYVQKGRR